MDECLHSLHTALKFAHDIRKAIKEYNFEMALEKVDALIIYLERKIKKLAG